LLSAASRWHRVRVGYGLQALVGRHEIALQGASAAGSRVIALPQGLGLVPVTSAVRGRLGQGDVTPFGPPFWSLTGGVEALARRISQADAIAYLEADIFGGAGTQAAVLWRGGEVVLGPWVSDNDTPKAAAEPIEQWPFNRVLRELGADRGAALDEFDAVGLGTYRSTDDWAAAAGPVRPRTRS
jgi:hypothetical protein